MRFLWNHDNEKIDSISRSWYAYRVFTIARFAGFAGFDGFAGKRASFLVFAGKTGKQYHFSLKDAGKLEFLGFLNLYYKSCLS